jgi:hypothetical protein
LEARVELSIWTVKNLIKIMLEYFQNILGSAIPEGFLLRTVHGFVEELVFADDPEYQWIDKIRTPRSTNEARQTLFFKLNGEVKRKIGLKVIFT